MGNLSLFFAEAKPIPPYFPAMIIAAVLLMVLVVLAVFLMSLRYKRCPSNRILVIYGRTGKQTVKCVHGGARFIIPLLEDYAWLSLEPLRIEIPLQELFSGAVRGNALGIFTVAVGTAPELMHHAALRLVGLTNSKIKQHAEDIIIGQLRRFIAAVQVQGVPDGSDHFQETLKNTLEPELQKIGLALINMNIPHDILDPAGR